MGIFSKKASVASDRVKSAVRGLDKSQPPGTNPYTNAANYVQDQNAILISSNHVWQVVALFALIISLASVVGLISVANKSKFIPYIVQVDKLGQSLGGGFANVAAVADERIVKASVAAFVVNARQVTPDINLAKRSIVNTYSMIVQQDPAYHKLSEWFRGGEAGNTPFKRAEREIVNADVRTVLGLAQDSWQIDWTETVRDRNGVVTGRYQMRAVVTIRIIPPTSDTTEEQLRMNPLGVYVKDFSWSRVV